MRPGGQQLNQKLPQSEALLGSLLPQGLGGLSLGPVCVVQCARVLYYVYMHACVFMWCTVCACMQYAPVCRQCTCAHTCGVLCACMQCTRVVYSVCVCMSRSAYKDTDPPRTCPHTGRVERTDRLMKPKDEQ